MKALLFLLLTVVIKSFITWEEERFQLQISSTIVDKQKFKNQLLFAVINKEPKKTVYKRKRI